jgi:hypothetical protein
MEVVPDALRRIAEALESISEKLEMMTQEKEVVPDSAPVHENVDDVDYEALVEKIEDFRFRPYKVGGSVVRALFSRPDWVQKECAINLSRFYGGVTAKQTKEAIMNGEIKSVIPDMRDVDLEQWNANEQKHELRKVKRPAGKYQVNLKSAILWLEQHGKRIVGQGNPICTCIEKIINP